MLPRLDAPPIGPKLRSRLAPRLHPHAPRDSQQHNDFQFGQQTIRTKVNLMVPKHSTVERVDVTAAMHEPPTGRPLALNLATLQG